MVCDTSTHLILCGIPGRGPGPDQWHYQAALQEAINQKKIATLAADAGYDSEANHVLARTRYHIRTIIPLTKGRHTTSLPPTRYRRIMRQRLPCLPYGQRWQVETVFSMVKRNRGCALRATSYWSQCREIVLRLFAHNVMIVLSAI